MAHSHTNPVVFSRHPPDGSSDGRTCEKCLGDCLTCETRYSCTKCSLAGPKTERKRGGGVKKMGGSSPFRGQKWRLFFFFLVGFPLKKRKTHQQRVPSNKMDAYGTRPSPKLPSKVPPKTPRVSTPEDVSPQRRFDNVVSINSKPQG